MGQYHKKIPQCPDHSPALHHNEASHTEAAAGKPCPQKQSCFLFMQKTHKDDKCRLESSDLQQIYKIRNPFVFRIPFCLKQPYTEKHFVLQYRFSKHPDNGGAANNTRSQGNPFYDPVPFSSFLYPHLSPSFKYSSTIQYMSAIYNYEIRKKFFHKTSGKNTARQPENDVGIDPV